MDSRRSTHTISPCFIEICPAPRLISNFGTNSGFTFLYPCRGWLARSPPHCSSYALLSRMQEPYCRSHQSSRCQSRDRCPTKISFHFTAAEHTNSYSSTPLFKRRRPPARIMERLLRGSHGILREQRHRAFFLQRRISIRYPGPEHIRQQSIQYESTTRKPTTRHSSARPAAQQPQSDRAVPQSVRRDGEH